MSTDWRDCERRALASLQRGEQELREGRAAQADAHLMAAAESLLEAAGLAPPSVAGVLAGRADEVMGLLGAPSARRWHRAPAEAASGPWQVVADTGVRLEDVVGLDEAKRLVYEMAVRPILDPEGARRWRQRAGGGILLYGPPGTGKTLFARAIAGELEATFLSVAGSGVLSKWFGEAERNVTALFDEAARHPRCVLFIDEVDAMLPARGQDQPHMSRVVSAFLAAMDGLAGRQEGLLLLGATNRPDEIDAAALRPNRFDRYVYVGLPGAGARRALLERHLDGMPLEGGVDLRETADRMDGYSGADVAALCAEAARRAWDREEAAGCRSPLSAEDLARALEAVHPSVGRPDVERCEGFRRCQSGRAASRGGRNGVASPSRVC